jgi:hypothetical protein
MESFPTLFLGPPRITLSLKVVLEIAFVLQARWNVAATAG